MISDANCGRSTKFHPFQLRRQTGNPCQNICAPIKKLLLIGATYLYRRGLAQESRHLSA